MRPSPISDSTSTEVSKPVGPDISAVTPESIHNWVFLGSGSYNLVFTDNLENGTWVLKIPNPFGIHLYILNSSSQIFSLCRRDTYAFCFERAELYYVPSTGTPEFVPLYDPEGFRQWINKQRSKMQSQAAFRLKPKLARVVQYIAANATNGHVPPLLSSPLNDYERNVRVWLELYSDLPAKTIELRDSRLSIPFKEGSYLYRVPRGTVGWVARRVYGITPKLPLTPRDDQQIAQRLLDIWRQHGRIVVDGCNPGNWKGDVCIDTDMALGLVRRRSDASIQYWQKARDVFPPFWAEYKTKHGMPLAVLVIKTLLHLEGIYRLDPGSIPLAAINLTVIQQMAPIIHAIFENHLRLPEFGVRLLNRLISCSQSDQFTVLLQAIALLLRLKDSPDIDFYFRIITDAISAQPMTPSRVLAHLYAFVRACDGLCERGKMTPNKHQNMWGWNQFVVDAVSWCRRNFEPSALGQQLIKLFHMNFSSFLVQGSLQQSGTLENAIWNAYCQQVHRPLGLPEELISGEPSDEEKPIVSSAAHASFFGSAERVSGIGEAGGAGAEASGACADDVTPQKQYRPAS